MKKVCFIEMEGVLLSYGAYVADESRTVPFLKELTSFTQKNNIAVYLVSGYHTSVAQKKFTASYLPKYFSEKHFLCVDDTYLAKKSDDDRKLHEKNLAKNPEFTDAYFKQIKMEEIVRAQGDTIKDALLLSDDVWVDGYYSQRFSKIDFAIFEENVVDRNKRIERIQGLAYFSLDPASVIQLLENFPRTEPAFLDKYVFNEMKKVLIGDNSNFVNAIKKGMEEQKNRKTNKGP